MNEQEKFNRVSIINVKNKLGLYEISSSGNIIYVRCPFCNSKEGAMKLNISNNGYVCKNCENSGYAIGLYARYNKISNKEAYKILMKEKAQMECSVNKNIVINSMKNDDVLDEIYNSFLRLLSLNEKHTKKLLNLGFDPDDIKDIGFKSIPTKEQEKIKICDKLIEMGYELSGTPGFYQDSKFRWTFKCHKGIFIPIRNNGRIVALRINLDEKYNTNTTDIWFSSNNKHNGTKVSNIIMSLLPKDGLIHILNNGESKKDIIIATEMILAYKIYKKYSNQIVIGVPNIISKNEIRKLNSIANIDNIYVVMDNHTVMHCSTTILSQLYKNYGSEKVRVCFSFKNCEIPEDINELQEENNDEKFFIKSA